MKIITITKEQVEKANRAKQAALLKDPELQAFEEEHKTLISTARKHQEMIEKDPKFRASKEESQKQISEAIKAEGLQKVAPDPLTAVSDFHLTPKTKGSSLHF